MRRSSARTHAAVEEVDVMLDPSRPLPAIEEKEKRKDE
jgi:hypothetical protein